MSSTFSLYAQALLYVAAGLLHFIKPQFYLGIMPPYLPAHRLLVALSGAAELGLGLGLLYAPTRSLAAWGIIAMLLVFQSVHVYMLQERVAGRRFRGLPVWALWLRLLFQFALIYWAWLFV